jgi:hypothetical protein
MTGRNSAVSSASPPKPHQNPAETLHIRRLENGLERPRGRSRPAARESASNRCVFVVYSLAGIVLKLPRVSYPAKASAGDVIEPNLRDTVVVGGGCPWQLIARSVILNVASNIFLRLQLGGEEGSMNFTPVLDELVLCKIAPTHHENTELDHFQSPINLTKFLNGGVADAFFTPPSPRFGRVVADRGAFWASRRYE